MRKALAPFGLLAIVASVAPAAAKVCPAGQILRVSLHTCVSKAAFQRYVHGGHASPAPRAARVTTLSRHVEPPTPSARPEVAALRGSERPDADVMDKPALRPTRPDPEPAPVAERANPLVPDASATPFGVLPSVSSFR